MDDKKLDSKVSEEIKENEIKKVAGGTIFETIEQEYRKADLNGEVMAWRDEYRKRDL